MTKLLSAPLIVKNESATLAACLDSIRPFADEVLVMDTGSTDDTLAIAREHCDFAFRSELFDENTDPHDFNFAEARNEVLAKAQGRWIMSIDADETVSGNGIREYLEANGKPFCGVRMLGCDGTIAIVPRVFANRPSIRWAGRYHDIPSPWESDNECLIPADVLTIHNSREAGPDRHARNIALLRRQFMEEQKVTDTALRLADAYRAAGVRFLGEALGYYHLFVDANDGMVGELCPYVLTSIADCYAKLGVMHMAIRYCQNVMTRFPAYIVAMVVTGEVYHRLGSYELAAAWYGHALDEPNPMQIHPRILTNINRETVEANRKLCLGRSKIDSN